MKDSTVKPFWCGRREIDGLKWRVRAIAAVCTWRPNVELPTLEAQRAAFDEFSADFQRIVDVISTAASYGPAPKYEREYAALSQILEAKFVPVAPLLSSYARPHRFRALWRSKTLDGLLIRDDGALIIDLIDTKHAVTMYADDLRLRA